MASQKHCALVLGLFETGYERVYRFARRSVDASTAEEVAQEVFVRLLAHADLENKSLSVSYLIKIADNLLKRRHRRAVRQREMTEDLARASGPCARAAAAREPKDWGRTRIEAAFDRLSGQERDAVRLVVCEGLSYEDAARSLGVRVSTLNNWKYRGIQKLKDDAAGDEDPAIRAAAGAGRRDRPRQGPLPQGAAPGDRRQCRANRAPR